jgi:hypothetical protein
MFSPSSASLVEVLKWCELVADGRLFVCTGDNLKEKEGAVLCSKSQETGGSRKIVKAIGDAGMVVGRHGS